MKTIPKHYESTALCSNKEKEKTKMLDEDDIKTQAVVIPSTSEVTVRWHDGYKEKFTRVNEVRFGSDLLWISLYDKNGNLKNRHIPLRSVRWFGLSEESHEDSHTT